MTNTSVLIIYGSVSGNTELVAQKVAEVFQTKEIPTTLSRVEKTQAKQILDHDLIILASPTYYHGETEAHFPHFLVEAKKLNLKEKKFAVIGLGDKKYYPEYLCDSAKILEDFVSEAGSELITPSLRIGTSPASILDTMIKNWAIRLADKIYQPHLSSN